MISVKSLLSFCLAASVSSSALAQPRVYFDFKGPSENVVMTVDAKDYEPSFWTGFLGSKEAFRSIPEAYRLMEEAYDHLVIGSSLFWGLGIATPLTFLAATDNSGLSIGVRRSVYWGTFLGGFFSGLYFQGLAGKKFLKGS